MADKEIMNGEFSVIPAGPVSITDLLRLSIERLGGEGASSVVDAIGKLVALQERGVQRQAELDFAQALADFQGSCPPIPKTKTANIVTASGSKFQYSYADLDQIKRSIQPLLTKYGLSYSWDSAEEGERIKVTCTIRHRGGHTTSATFSCPTDSKAAMSGAQKSGAALTYALRQSLRQALGLTTTDDDTDGAAVDDTKITPAQAADLSALIDEVKADRAKFLKYMGVETIEDIPAARFKGAVFALESRRNKP